LLTADTILRVNMYHSAIFRANRSSSCRDMAVLTFFKMDLLYACLDHPRRVFGGLCHCAKFSL